MYLLGIDGGGTKTKIYLSDFNSKIILNAEFSGSNYLAKGLNNTAKVISDIFKFIDNNNIEINQIEGICFGAAGAGRDKDKNLLKNIFISLGYKGPIFVYDDAYISLVGAHGKEKGAITISGTGSIALAVDDNKNVYRVGGWGHIIGDEGSGYYIGKLALNAIFRAYDGRCNSTELANSILEYLKLNSIEDLLYYIHENSIDKSRIAKLAEIVIKCALGNDYISERIIENAIDELIFMTSTIRRKVKNDIDISYSGGLFKNEYFKGLFIEKINKLYDLNIIAPKFDPGLGALILAYINLGLEYDINILKNTEGHKDARISVYENEAGTR